MMDKDIESMSDRELLEEMAANSRQVRDTVTRVVADFEGSALGQMLKGGGKVNLLSLMKL